MEELKKFIHNFSWYEKEFSTWNCEYVRISKDIRMYTLYKPCSTKKVTLYRDGMKVFIYGDYGNWIFSEMTYKADPHNLKYDDLGYMIGKLDSGCRNEVKVYNNEQAWNDILKWHSDFIREYTDEELWIEVMKLWEGRSSDYIPSELDIEDYFLNLEVDDGYTAVDDYVILESTKFTAKLLDSISDEIDYQCKLRSLNMEDFDCDKCGCELYYTDFGKVFNQGFLISLYAMYVYSKKDIDHFKEGIGIE